MSITISGPVDIDILRYNGVKIILLSDKHHSSKGICNMKCDDEHREDSTASCYTVSGLIDRVIKHANRNGRYVDVYLEALFPIIMIKSETTKREASQPSIEPNRNYSLGMTLTRYSNCLYDRTSCPYNNARFHHVDPRLQLIGYGLPMRTENFFIDLLTVNAPNVFINQEDTLRVHLDFFRYAFIIATFSNTPRFIDSNLWTYYNLVINSDNFTRDVESYLRSILVMDPQYIEDTINLLAYRYPNLSSNIIRGAVTNEVDTTFELIRELLLSSAYVTKRIVLIDGVSRRKVMHKIRTQLLGLELQGDSERAESLRQFIYRKASMIDLSPANDYFELYNNARMTYIVTRDASVFALVSMIDQSLTDGILGYSEIELLMMDLYTLARMLRTFPMRHQTKTARYHVLPSYIIEYAGGSHIDNTIEYFTSIGAQREYFATNSEGKRCTRVPSNAFD